ncbi:MAG: hypothetical protein WC294_09330 [Methanoregula sp.]
MRNDQGILTGDTLYRRLGEVLLIGDYAHCVRIISHLLTFSPSVKRVFAGLVDGRTTTGNGTGIFIIAK